MFGTTWSHNILRKYVILFGTLFNNIYINRDTKTGEVIQTIKVPLSYGPKEKFLSRLEGDPNLDRQVAIVLPRMAFEMTTFQYAPERKINRLNKIYAQIGTKTDYHYSPVPYDIQFQLNIMVKNVEDGTRIVEQILPYFAPEWTASVHLIDGFAPYDIPLIINDISVDDTYSGNFEQRRAIIWTLTFTMKAFVFGPTIDASKKIIKFSSVGVKISDDPQVNNTELANTVLVSTYPGLTVSGQPTSNSTISIPYTEIDLDNDYGFITDITEKI
jgi:hypothetical protein